EYGGDTMFVDISAKQGLHVDTDGDIHASRDYRRRLLLALTGRELSKAYERARDGAEEVAI
ncbi:hypothetical protein ACWEWX_29100, partial [Streptomyces asiaticus]